MTTRKKKTEPEIATEPTTEVEAKVATPKSKHPIEYYKGAGIPFCESCGAPKSTGLRGEVICPEGQADCPQLAAEKD